MLGKNRLKQKIDSGQAVIGTFSIIPSTVNADIISSSGLDFLIIDCEHGPISFETAQDMAMACQSRNVSPVVRVSGVNENEILKALDIGAHCIHVPNISTKSELEKAIQFSKYPPEGKRGFSPYTRAGGYSSENAKTLTESANQNTLLAVHIENNEAIKNIDTILKSPELDIIFLGVYDLSKSLGIPGQIDSPIISALLENISKKAARNGKTIGTIVTNEHDLKKYLNFGIRYIAYSVDCSVILESFKKINSNFRNILI